MPTARGRLLRVRKGLPAVRNRIVSAACGRWTGIGEAATRTTPNDHPAPCPYGGVANALIRRRGCDIGYLPPSIRCWVICCVISSEEACRNVPSTPDDHLRACPHGLRIGAAGRRADHAYGCPSVGDWVIATAIVR